jgi:glycosyltransferase involved in cell wall biosynthesis
MNPPTRLVSIVVPAYNHGRYLAECIDSILGQTYREIELIVLDDGSTDNTRAILDSYGDRVRWETQVNSGQSATLNRGWAMCTGEFLAYLSADDVLYPDAVARAVALLQANPATVVAYPDFDLINADSRRLRRITAPEFDAFDLYWRLVCQPGPGAVFRRSSWGAAGPWNPDLRQNPDLDFWMRMALQGDFRRIPAALAAFRVHPESQTFRHADLQRAEEPMVIVEQFLERGDLPAWLRQGESRVRAAAHLASAQLHLHSGRWRAAISHAFAAWSSSPRAVLAWRTLRMMGSVLFGRVSHSLRTAGSGHRP